MESPTLIRSHLKRSPFFFVLSTVLRSRNLISHNKFFPWSSDHSIYRNFLYLEMVRGRPPTTLGGPGYGQLNHVGARPRWRWWWRGRWYRFWGWFCYLVPAPPLRCAVVRSSFLNTAVSSNRNLTAFRGRRRPKPISTKFSDDHGKNLLCEIRFLDLRTGADRDETDFSSNGNESKWECAHQPETPTTKLIRNTAAAVLNTLFHIRW